MDGTAAWPNRHHHSPLVITLPCFLFIISSSCLNFLVILLFSSLLPCVRAIIVPFCDCFSTFVVIACLFLKPISPDRSTCSSSFYIIIFGSFFFIVVYLALHLFWCCGRHTRYTSLQPLSFTFLYLITFPTPLLMMLKLLIFCFSCSSSHSISVQCYIYVVSFNNHYRAL